MLLLSLLGFSPSAVAAPPSDISFYKAPSGKKQMSTSSAKAEAGRIQSSAGGRHCSRQRLSKLVWKTTPSSKVRLENARARSNSKHKPDKLYQSTVKTFSGYYAEEAMARAAKAPSVVQRKGGCLRLIGGQCTGEQHGSMLNQCPSPPLKKMWASLEQRWDSREG